MKLISKMRIRVSPLINKILNLFNIQLISMKSYSYFKKEFSSRNIRDLRLFYDFI
jgi:hypothetical protein